MEKWHMVHKIHITGSFKSIYHNTWLRRTCAIYGQIPGLRRHKVKTRNLVNKWRVCDVTVFYDILAWSSLWCGSIEPTFTSQFLLLHSSDNKIGLTLVCTIATAGGCTYWGHWQWNGSDQGGGGHHRVLASFFPCNAHIGSMLRSRIQAGTVPRCPLPLFRRLWQMTCWMYRLLLEYLE